MWSFPLKISKIALARWSNWLEWHPVHQKVMDSIPGQDTYPGFGAYMGGNQTMFFTLMFLSLPLPLSLKSIFLKDIYIYRHIDIDIPKIFF